MCRSVEASPRSTGATAAARRFRSGSGRGSNPWRRPPSGSGLPWPRMNSSAWRIRPRELRSHSWEVRPHVVRPWPPRTTPLRPGRDSWMRSISSASSNPGRRHGTQATSSPKHCLVSSSPSAAAASAMMASGWRWSTCGTRSSPCIEVSMLGGAPPWPKRQKSSISCSSSSCSSPRYTSLRPRSRSTTRADSPSADSVPRSPPDPLTHISSTSSPETGSSITALAEVFPPP